MKDNPKLELLFWIIVVESFPERRHLKGKPATKKHHVGRRSAFWMNTCSMTLKWLVSPVVPSTAPDSEHNV